MTLRVVLAEDEPVARTRLSRLLKDAGCEVLEEFENGASLLAWLQQRPAFDVLFLDIRMPGPSGLEVKAELPEDAPVVFVTANPEHAVAAFEQAALDFLVKPVTPERLEKTLRRIRMQHSTKNDVSKPETTTAAKLIKVPVKAGDGTLLLELRRITHFEVECQVVYAWLGGRRFRTSCTSLQELEDSYPHVPFLRIQRHLLIRPESVTGLRTLPGGRHMVLLAEGVELEASRNAYHQLKLKLGL